MREEEIGDETDGEFSLMSITRHDHTNDANDEGGGGGSTRSTSNGRKPRFMSRLMAALCGAFVRVKRVSCGKSEDLGKNTLCVMSLSITYESITHSLLAATSTWCAAKADCGISGYPR